MEGSGDRHLFIGLNWVSQIRNTYRDFEIWLKGALGVECLCGNSVKGNWRQGSLLGTLQDT
jgi:hypothetical protein